MFTEIAIVNQLKIWKNIEKREIFGTSSKNVKCFNHFYKHFGKENN